ncbi:MAG: FemAB family PEP-CTERM system-associated protein [Phycisphaeraceae bacterium]|nr:FemAB family PEP-CTERM system-associated protein [Phycisphaeraceae bacterium]
MSQAAARFSVNAPSAVSPPVTVQEHGRLDALQRREIQGFLAGLKDSGGGEMDPRWLDVLSESMGHEPHVLIARQGEGPLPGVVGYLPLSLVSSRFFGRFLVSLPYVNRAGVAAANPAAAEALVERAATLADRLNVDYLELRQSDQGCDLPGAAINARRDEKVRMVLDLPASDEALDKALGSKLRSQVRKGEKAGLSIRWGDSAELFDGFYRVFSHNMRDLGTPVYPRKLFEAILTHFRGEAELAIVEHEGQTVAGALLMHYPAMGEGALTAVPSASALRSSNAVSANMWMYRQLLRRAIERGSGAFDFGRSSVDSGTYQFKKQWGAQPRPTTWLYHVRRGDPTRMTTGGAGNAWKIAAWRRLPLWLSRWAGPRIVRGIP